MESTFEANHTQKPRKLKSRLSENEKGTRQFQKLATLNMPLHQSLGILLKMRPKEDQDPPNNVLKNIYQIYNLNCACNNEL